MLSDSGILAYPVCTCRQAKLSSLVVPPGIDLNTTTVTEMVVAVINSQVAEEPGVVRLGYILGYARISPCV